MLPKKPKVFIIVSVLSVFGFLFSNALAETNSSEQAPVQTKKNEEVYEVSGPRTIEVVLQRRYLDGEISEEKVQEKILSMEDFWSQYSSWKLVDQKKNKMVFQKDVDDISPLLKANGYFGLTEDGVLSIFKGKPGPDNVIQSFFQIDVDKLQSRDQQQLKEGIPIQSKDHYQQVIESFKSFSLH